MLGLDEVCVVTVPSPVDNLSPRQRDVLRPVARGRTNKAIALSAKLGVLWVRIGRSGAATLTTVIAISLIGFGAGAVLSGASSGSPDEAEFSIGVDANPNRQRGEQVARSASTRSAWEGFELVSLGDAYIPLGRANSVEDMVSWTHGAAVVEIVGIAEQFRLYDERRPATAADVAEFAAKGKALEEGQLIGPAGFLMTRFDARVWWLDGTVEDGQVVVSGGIVDDVVFELEGLPLPEPGGTYFYFLRRSPEGLVPEAIQFTVDTEEKLGALTFPESGLAQALSGRSVNEVRDDVLRAYREGDLPPQEAARVEE